jgi:hypothetical protein
MPSRVTLTLVAVLALIAGLLINACYNAPQQPPVMPLTPEVTATPGLEPENAETPPPPWPIGQLKEENITPEATSTPSPTETPLPTATATETPYGQTPAPTETPTPTPTESPIPTQSPEPTPQPDFSQNLPAGQLSDQSLDGEINASTPPARATSIRIADGARRELLKHQPDEAIRTLGRALSIDASNPYVYFYLGRAYLMKHNYGQALTFWQRAAISFSDNPKWLGETLSFEGAAKERLGEMNKARRDYARALKLAPDNQLAKIGIDTLGPPPTPEPKPSAEPTDELPGEVEPPSEPEEAAPPPVEGEPAPPPAAGEPLPAEEPGVESPSAAESPPADESSPEAQPSPDNP